MTTTTECQRCGAGTRDAAYSCEGCLDRLARALGEVPWVEEEIRITIAKQRGIDYRTLGDSAGSEEPVPINVAAHEKRDALRSQLVTFIRFCEEEGIRNSDHREGLPENTLTAMSRWLLWRVDGLALNDMGTEWIDSIADAVNACKRVIDRPPERQYAGPCSGCKRDLYAKPGAAEVTCRDCAVVYTIADLHEWMKAQVYGRLVTAREGSTLLCRFGMETAQKTIDSWHTRKLLVDHGSDAKKKRLYLFDDLVTLAARHSTKVGA